jgi:3-oxoacyl-[acyl-carrier-protein] synthase II
MLQRGEADVILAGGSESIISTVYMAGLARMGALSKWPGDPTGASRPFDAERSGFVFGEGGAAMVLEKEEPAQERGATILAKVLGGSMTNDAFHVTAPDPGGEGAVRAIQLALKDAGLAVCDVDVIFAHGTSTPLNDVTETKAIKTALGEHAYNTPVSATKSMIGHTMGAAGAISAVAAVKGLYHGLVPPTINYETPDPECDLDYNPIEARPLAHRTSMINAFGFGGHNVVLLLGTPDGKN